MHRPRSGICCALLSVCLLCACAGDRKSVGPTDLPAQVQATLEHEAQGGAIDKIVKETTTAGVTYKANVSATNGQKWEVLIDGNGKLVYKHLR
jgi:hypothetical protein